MFKRIFIEYFKRHLTSLILIILMILIVTVLALVPAQILRIIVDDIIFNNKANLLLLFGIIYALSYLLIGVFNFLKNLLMLNTSQGFLEFLRGKMLTHIHKIKYQDMVNNDSGTFEAYFNNDTNSINELFTSGVIDMVTDLFKIFGIVISIFIYSLRFGIIILIILPLIIIVTGIIRNKMLKAQLSSKNLEGNVNKILLENVEGIKEIKTNHLSSYVKEKYMKILNNHFKANQASNFYDSFFSPLMQIIRNLVVALILIVSGINLDIFGMTIGMVISAITLISDLFTPIENLGTEIQTIQKSVAAIKRINEFFTFPSDFEKKETLLGDKINISYKNVSFNYDKEVVIKDFSLFINSGEKITFQGPSGSGKSTLMKLALGIIKPSSGEVLINNCPIYLIDNATRRKYFQIVYQEPFFSNGTIYEELTLRDFSISKEKCQEALNIVGLDYIVNLDLILNKDEYSSGELALLNIARVLVHNPKVIFLDEMNAKIDPFTASKIIKIINSFAKDKIVISINHYGDILENSKIIKLDNQINKSI